MRLFNFSNLLVSSSLVFSCSTEKHSTPQSVDGVSVENLTSGMGKETKTVEGLYRLNHNVDDLLSGIYPKDQYINVQTDSCFALPAKVTFTGTWTTEVEESFGPEVKRISDYTIDEVVFKSSAIQFISDCSKLGDIALPSEIIIVAKASSKIIVRNSFIIKFPSEVDKILPGGEENIVIEYKPITGEWRFDDFFELSMYGLDAPKLFHVSQNKTNTELGSIGNIGSYAIEFNYICGLSSDSKFKAAALLTDDKCNIKTEELTGGPDGPEYINIIDIEPITK